MIINRTDNQRCVQTPMYNVDEFASATRVVLNLPDILLEDKDQIN